MFNDLNAPNTHDKGDLIRLDTQILVSGTYIDPDHLSLYVVDPDGTEKEFIYGATGTFIREAVGRYYLDYYISQYGQYTYGFYASGTAWGYEEKVFTIRKRNT